MARGRISGELSARMSLMAFVCSCLIVAIHTTPNGATEMSWLLTKLLFADGLCRIAIPYFFVASGFLLGCHLKDDHWWRYAVVSRARTLVVPYFIWIFIGQAIMYAVWIMTRLKGYDCGMSNPWGEFSLLKVTSIFGGNPFKNIGPLWYLRDLYILVVVSPIIVNILRKKIWGKCYIAFLVVVYACYMISPLATDYKMKNCFEYFISLRGILYFSVGIALAPSMFRRFVPFVLFSKLSLGVGVFFLCLKVYSKYVGYELLVPLCDVVFVPFLCYGVFQSLPKCSMPDWLIRSSFPIYLMHGIVLFISVAILVLIGLRQYLSCSVLMALARMILAVVISMLVAVGIRKFFPKLALVLFGGR